MKRAKCNGREGFSLIEVVVAITLLGLVTAPVGASLILAQRINLRSEALMQDQLAVTSAVETLMAEGIAGESENYASGRFQGVTVKTAKEGASYKVTASGGSVSIDTYIRPADTEEGGG